LQYLPKDKVISVFDENEKDDYVLPDFLYHLDEIDVDSGLTNCGNGESYITTLKMYLDMAASNADEIEKFWAEKDIRNTTIKVHSLKSTSRVIGALKLGEFAARLEKAGDEGDTETLDRELADFISKYRKLAKDLEPLNERNDLSETDNRPLITADKLDESYKAISEFYESFDFDSVVDVAESLKEYRIPESEAKKVNAIIKAVDNYDYEMIPKIIGVET